MREGGGAAGGERAAARRPHKRRAETAAAAATMSPWWRGRRRRGAAMAVATAGDGGGHGAAEGAESGPEMGEAGGGDTAVARRWPAGRCAARGWRARRREREVRRERGQWWWCRRRWRRATRRPRGDTRWRASRTSTPMKQRQFATTPVGHLIQLRLHELVGDRSASRLEVVQQLAVAALAVASRVVDGRQCRKRKLE